MHPDVAELPLTTPSPSSLRLRVGYEITYHCLQETPMILMVNIHYSRASDLIIADQLTTNPAMPDRKSVV